MTLPNEQAEGYNGLTSVEHTLPSQYYLDPQHHQKELQAIWYRNWVYVCRSSELEGLRAFRTFELGDQQVLILRDEENQLQAFHNTCRHRGSILCTEAQGRLTSKSLVCPYHSWTYSLQGDLQRTPSKQLPAQFDKSEHSLYPVALQEWKGFIFINLAAELAQPFQQSFHKDSVNLNNWPLAELEVGHVYRKTMACNWKIFWENFNECLHCPRVHPELSKLVPIYSRAIMEPNDHPDWAQHVDHSDPKLKGGMREGADTWSHDGQVSGEPFSGLTEAEQKAGYSYVVNQPSIFIVAHVDYVRIVRLLPLGPERTEIQAQWLFSKENLANPEFDPAQVASFAQLVLDQDARVSEINQRGLRSIKHQQGTLMAEEYAVHEFQNWVRTQLK